MACEIFRGPDATNKTQLLRTHWTQALVSAVIRNLRRPRVNSAHPRGDIIDDDAGRSAYGRSGRGIPPAGRGRAQPDLTAGCRLCISATFVHIRSIPLGV